MKKMLDVFGLEHPVALVTGAGADRLGKCIAHTLWNRGYRLAVHGWTSYAKAKEEAKRLRKTGEDARAFLADIRKEHEVERMIDQVFEHFERIDVLVNCAAIWESRSLSETSAEDLRRHWETNTLGTFLCCQHVGKVMVGQPFGGAIINIGDWGNSLPYLDYSAYFSSKGAIPTLTRTMAVELADRNKGIRVNAVMPGPVTLPKDMSPEDREASINATLVKREGSPQHVADAVVALIENDYITGACLAVDGGRGIKKN